MAKTTTCVFCGKEMKDTFFSSEGTTATLMGEFSGTVRCCDECAAKYDNALTSEEKKRFAAKVENYCRSNKKKSSDSKLLTDLFFKYLAEKEAFEKKDDGSIPMNFNDFYSFCGDKFWVREFKLGFENSTMGLNDMVKTRKKEMETFDSVGFTKDDISKIEYRIAENAPSSFVLLHKYICSVDIRLNDEKTMTYRPTVARFVFSYNNPLPFLKTKNAKKVIEKALKEFKETVGSDLPVVCVKKFN